MSKDLASAFRLQVDVLPRPSLTAHCQHALHPQFVDARVAPKAVDVWFRDFARWRVTFPSGCPLDNGMGKAAFFTQ